VHSKSFAMTQNQLGKTLRGFILAVTGNHEGKDEFKKFNYMQNGEGPNFLKKILKKSDILQGLDSFEERFMPKEARNSLSRL